MSGALTVVAGIPIPSSSPAFLAGVGLHVIPGAHLYDRGHECDVQPKVRRTSPPVRLGLLLVFMRIVRDRRWLRRGALA